MQFRQLLLALAVVCPLPAQTFLHLTDTQFGMYTKNREFRHETANLEFVVATANRLKPAFVVITGDLVNEPGNKAQINEYKRILAQLDPKIAVYSVAGNHDVGNKPTKESLATYREHLGKDYYTFRIGDMAGFVLNSNLEKAPENAPDEAAKMESWFRTELDKAHKDGVKNLIVFQHIPFFIKDPGEAEVYDNVAPAARARYLKMLHEAGVKHVFAGHLHYNLEAHDGDLEIMATAPVGMPIGENNRSGIRVVKVTPNGVTHRFYDLGQLPESVE